jgi:hypothetical protein
VQQYLANLENWEQRLTNDEWFFVRIGDDLVDSLTPPEAFSAIDQIIDHLLTTDDSNLQIELILLIQSLARKADTTEMPPKLQQSLGLISKDISNTSRYHKMQFDDLLHWFRCDSP